MSPSTTRMWLIAAGMLCCPGAFTFRAEALADSGPQSLEFAIRDKSGTTRGLKMQAARKLLILLYLRAVFLFQRRARGSPRLILAENAS